MYAPMRTNYFGHDKQYQKRKAEGHPGWETAEVIRENLAALAAMLAAWRVPGSGKLLELGCGAGDLSLWLAQQGYQVWGVDIAPTAVQWAREKAEQRGVQVHFAVGDVLSLDDYADDFFDLVLDGCCLHCIIGDDRRRLLASALRVLKPGGLFLVKTMCNGPKTPEMKPNFDPASRCIVYGDLAIRYMGLPENIRSEITSSGFRIASWQVDVAQPERGEDMLRASCVKPGTFA